MLDKGLEGRVQWGIPKGYPPPPPRGGGVQESCQMRYCTTTKNPTVTHSGVVVLFIPFLASFLLHNHNLPNYQLLLLADIPRSIDLFAVVRILFY